MEDDDKTLPLGNSLPPRVKKVAKSGMQGAASLDNVDVTTFVCYY